MRIGIDVRALMEDKTTGIQVYIVNLLHALFKLDQTNNYVLFANSFTKIDSLVRRFHYPNVEYCTTHYPNKLFNLSQKFFAFPKIDGLTGKVDLFFSPHWRLAALSKNIPLLITFHDLSFEIMPEFFTIRRRLWHRFMNYRQAAGRAAKIVAVSKNTQKDLIDLYGVPESKIEVIYPGVRPLPQPLPRGGGQEGGYFLYFGTFEPRKNVAAVLEAYEAYYRQSRVKRPLVLAGSVGWKTKLLIPPGLRDKITVRQNVDEEKKREFFSSAFAFLFLSHYEGFGFPVLEAASAGLPVISSFATSLAEIGGEFVLLVNPFRPFQVTEAMLALEEDRQLYEMLSRKGQEAVKQFAWKKTAKQTLELFTKLCA